MRDNIKIDVIEMGCECVDSCDSACGPLSALYESDNGPFGCSSEQLLASQSITFTGLVIMKFRPELGALFANSWHPGS
jgi:hypothetical protein